jgi:hypothetical protein
MTTADTPDWAAGKPTRRSHGRGRQRLTRAIKARRQLNLAPGAGAEPTPDRRAVNLPTYEYLIRTHG